MADEKETTEEKKEDSGSFHLGDLRELIAQEVKKAAGALTSTDTKEHKEAEKLTEKGLDSKSNIAAQVQQAIDEIQGKEKAAQREKDIDDKLAELTKRTEEKTPVERRRVHKFMGWGE